MCEGVANITQATSFYQKGMTNKSCPAILNASITAEIMLKLKSRINEYNAIKIPSRTKRVSELFYTPIKVTFWTFLECFLQN